MLITADIMLKGKIKLITICCEKHPHREYESCLETEIQSKMTGLIDCVPLWFVEDPQQVCQINMPPPT